MGDHRQDAPHTILLAPALCLAVGALLLPTSVLIQTIAAAPPGPVFSVAALRAALQADPRSWTGRAIQVRGLVVQCPGTVEPGHECTSWSPDLVDALEPGAVALPLGRAEAGALRIMVRRVPVLGDLLAPPQVVRWGAVANYRVRLQALPRLADPTTLPYQALLLDAAPGSP